MECGHLFGRMEQGLLLLLKLCGSKSFFKELFMKWLEKFLKKVSCKNNRKRIYPNEWLLDQFRP
jgi:hypothetical protein